MSEIVDDLKLSNLEISNELGIRLTAQDANIKYSSRGGWFNILSNGNIFMNAGENDSDNDNDSDAGDIEFDAGYGYETKNGGNLSLYGGWSYGTGNGGDVNIEAGYANNGYAGDLELYAGSANGVTGGVAGGDVYIQSGASYQGITGSFVEIKGGYANTTGGDVNIYAGNGNQNNNGNINLTSNEIHLNGSIIYDMDEVASQGTNNGGNRIPLTTVITKLEILLNTTGLMYINDGVNGQMKIITIQTDNGGTGNITLTGNHTYFSNIVFNGAGDTVTLVFIANNGWVISGSGGPEIIINY